MSMSMQLWRVGPALALLMFLPGIANAAAPGPLTEKAAAEAEATVFSRLKLEGYSGSVTVLRKEKLVFQGAAGEAAPGRPFAPTTKVDIASISKPITAMAIFTLVEAGKVGLDDPLGRWFPEAPDDKKSITIRQMLNHTSGLVDIPEGMTDYRPTTEAEMSRRIFAEPLDFPPGTKNSYSNSGFNLLGIIVEKASGQSLFDYLEAQIFRPAHVQASYDPETFPANEVASAVSEETKSQTVRELAAARKGPFWGLWGAGGIFMSSPDLARLFRAFWDGKIVSKASVRQMIENPYPAGSYAGEALGWTIIHTDRGEDFVSYTGGSEHSRAAIRFYPKEEVTVATLSNSKSPGAIRVARELAEPIVGPDFRKNEIPSGTPPLAKANPADVRAINDFIAAVAGDDEARRGYIERSFAPAYRSEVGEEALAEKIGGLAAIGNPRIVSIYRDGNDTVLMFETQESEYPRLYRLTLSRSSPDGLIEKYAIARIAPK